MCESDESESDGDESDGDDAAPARPALPDSFNCQACDLPGQKLQFFLCGCTHKAHSSTHVSLQRTAAHSQTRRTHSKRTRLSSHDACEGVCTWMCGCVCVWTGRTAACPVLWVCVVRSVCVWAPVCVCGCGVAGQTWTASTRLVGSMTGSSTEHRTEDGVLL